MDVHIHSHDVDKVTNFDGGKGLSLVTLKCGSTDITFFLPTDKAATLFPALQKVYENVQQTEKA